jgi:hypothetical protein
MRRSDELRPRYGFREPLARFLIVCEGTVTEPHYFREVRRLERGMVDLEIVSGGVPKTLVERAVEKQRASDREATRRGNDNLRYDQVWCVFDIDEHPFVPEARQTARDNAIHVAVSNPCFELWLLLHFQDQTAHVERDRVARVCRKHMPGYDKTPDCDKLMPLLQEAIARAIQLDKWQESRDNAGGNPSTGVYQLVQQIKAVRESPTIDTR